MKRLVLVLALVGCKSATPDRRLERKLEHVCEYLRTELTVTRKSLDTDPDLAMMMLRSSLGYVPACSDVNTEEAAQATLLGGPDAMRAAIDHLLAALPDPDSTPAP